MNEPNRISQLRQLIVALKDLLKATEQSQTLCDQAGLPTTDNHLNGKHWTRAALRRDQCYAYAQDQAVKFFSFKREDGA